MQHSPLGQSLIAVSGGAQTQSRKIDEARVEDAAEQDSDFAMIVSGLISEESSDAFDKESHISEGLSEADESVDLTELDSEKEDDADASLNMEQDDNGLLERPVGLNREAPAFRETIDVENGKTTAPRRPQFSANQTESGRLTASELPEVKHSPSLSIDSTDAAERNGRTDSAKPEAMVARQSQGVLWLPGRSEGETRSGDGVGSELRHDRDLLQPVRLAPDQSGGQLSQGQPQKPNQGAAQPVLQGHQESIESGLQKTPAVERHSDSVDEAPIPNRTNGNRSGFVGQPNMLSSVEKTLAKPNARPDVVSIHNFTFESEAVPESRLAADVHSSVRVTPEGAIHRADLPRHVSLQLAQALQQNGNRPIEIQLNPIELGRVKISLHSNEGSVVVQVVADRPETLDLMRRNIELLAEDFGDLGYDQAQFSFSRSETDGQQDEASNLSSELQEGEQPLHNEPSADDADQSKLVTKLVTDRLDIRI